MYVPLHCASSCTPSTVCRSRRHAASSEPVSMKAAGRVSSLSGLLVIHMVFRVRQLEGDAAWKGGRKD